MLGMGRQPRSLAELLADLTRRDRGGDLDTRSDSSISSVSTKTSVVRATSAPTAPIVGNPAVPSLPLVVIGTTTTPIRTNSLPAGIPGFNTIPANGFPENPARTSTSSTLRTTSTPVVVAPIRTTPVLVTTPAATSSPSPVRGQPATTVPAAGNSPVLSVIAPPPASGTPPLASGPSSSTPLTGAPAATEISSTVPGREASTEGGTGNNSSQQTGILAGSIVGVMLLAAIIAFFCIRRNKKAKKARAASSAALPTSRNSGSISGSISYPVQRSNSNPWSPPLRKPGGASDTQPMAAAAWPMGQANNRNSMDRESLDEKQYLAYQNLVGDANNQISPPPVPPPPPAALRQQSQGAATREMRYLSASSADPYEQVNGRYSKWPAVPPLPTDNYNDGSRNESPVPQGLAPPPSQQQMVQPTGRTMDEFPVAARINEHYARTEKQLLSASYNQPGVDRSSIYPPSPLFFKFNSNNGSGAGAAADYRR